jgi:hypothetical protein
MEADWEIELANDAPVIDASWAGFVDLHLEPERAAELSETRQLPTLSEVLVRLNLHASPVWTSKCDVWMPAEFDPDELAAPPDDARYALACYIDMLPGCDRQWPNPEAAIADCETLCIRLRDCPIRSCRVDLVIRHAFLAPDWRDLGITAYLTACGPSQHSAAAQLAFALAAFADSVCLAIYPAATNS